MNEVQTDWFLVLLVSLVIWWFGYRDQQKRIASRPEIAVPAWLARFFGSPRGSWISLHGAATQLLGIGMILLMLFLSLTVDSRRERMELWQLGFIGLMILAAALTVLLKPRGP